MKYNLYTGKCKINIKLRFSDTEHTNVLGTQRNQTLPVDPKDFSYTYTVAVPTKGNHSLNF